MNRLLRRRTVAAACVIALTLMINPGLASAQDSLEEWEERELQPLIQGLGETIVGDRPSETPFEMAFDFLKGVEGSIYTPFTLTIDPSLVTKSEIAMYLFVKPQPAAPPAADPAAAGGGDTPEAAPEDPFADAIYEDLFFVDVSDNTTDDDQLKIHRAFQAPAGAYDVYVVVRDSAGEDGEDADLAESMVMVHKQPVEVPDFWNGELQTSTILVAQTMDLLDNPLSAEDQRVNPYTIGTTEIIPKRDGDFTKEDNLSLLFYVYNPQLTAEQNPDVTVEFEFHRVSPAGESFFNRTNPQQFNSQTWPPGVPVTGGLPSGQAVPLGSFPEGDFRLEIKITDNASEQTLTRDVNFSVSE